MKATISSIIYANADKMWEELQKSSSLMYIASPIIKFKSQDGSELPAKWEVGKKYSLKIFALHIIPLGKHYIVVKSIDAKSNQIFSNESGSLTKTWNHLVRVERLSENMLKYTDEIEIEAGMLTVFVWMFAQIFYRHRQQKWKRLLTR
jgi:hypothetical protein